MLLGNFYLDKKVTTVNLIEGCGKFVVCDTIIKEEVVKKVLKTSIEVLVKFDMLKTLANLTMAGALGGFNAHTNNIVTTICRAIGQDFS